MVSNLKKRKFYFKKGLLLRKINLIRKRDFYEEKKVLLGKKLYYEKKVLF